MIDMEFLTQEAWATARLSHQAKWDGLSELHQNEFRQMAKEVVDGKVPDPDATNNRGRFERAVAAHLANMQPAEEAVVEEIAEEAAEVVEEEPAKPEPKTAKKLAAKKKSKK